MAIQSEPEPPIGAFFGGVMAGILLCSLAVFISTQLGIGGSYENGYADGREQAHQDIRDFCMYQREAE